MDRRIVLLILFLSVISGMSLNAGVNSTNRTDSSFSSESFWSKHGIDSIIIDYVCLNSIYSSTTLDDSAGRMTMIKEREFHAADKRKTQTIRDCVMSDSMRNCVLGYITDLFISKTDSIFTTPAQPGLYPCEEGSSAHKLKQFVADRVSGNKQREIHDANLFGTPISTYLYVIIHYSPTGFSRIEEFEIPISPILKYTAKFNEFKKIFILR